MEAVIDKAKILLSPHGFSTRLGGVSTGIFESLNLGWRRQDDPENLKENWKRFLSACDMSGKNVVFSTQVHGTYVHISDYSDSRLAEELPCSLVADGFVTNKPGLPIAVTTADCIPLLLEDTVNNVIGAVHCGWRGTVADIEKEAIEKMLFLGAETKHIKAAIGPAIDRCCFEVGEEVIEAVNTLLQTEATDFYNQKENGKYMLDLRGVLKERLLQLGLEQQNLEITGLCTMCHPERYFSHRYTGGKRGSQYAIIMLKDV